MNLGLRLLLAVAFLGLLGLGGAWLFDGGEAEGAHGGDARSPTVGQDPRFRWTSSVQCKECHQDVWDEWYGSHHQISYLNPEVAAQSQNFQNKECQACHLPQQIAVTGFAQRALPRMTRYDQGVDCITCHVSGEGEVFAAHAVPSAPCKPVADTRFTSMDLCEGCHNQHFTTDQWRASAWAKKGTSCNDCHMPDVERKLAAGGTRKGRHHGFAGAHDAAMLEKAGTFEYRVEGKELVLALTNSGAGHNFPTEERHRAVDIVYSFTDRDGKHQTFQDAAQQPTEFGLAYRFRQPYRDEAGENTQLVAGDRKEVRVPIPDGSVSVKLRVWYRLQPYIGDSHPASTLLEEHEIDLR
ncbi:MAG: multiheme c-type cytochrome [Planctomycetota bacterium]